MKTHRYFAILTLVCMAMTIVTGWEMAIQKSRLLLPDEAGDGSACSAGFPGTWNPYLIACPGGMMQGRSACYASLTADPA